MILSEFAFLCGEEDKSILNYELNSISCAAFPHEPGLRWLSSAGPGAASSMFSSPNGCCY